MRAIIFGLGLAVAATGAASAQDAANGEKVFARCKACHVIDQPQNKVGPHLVGVFGRKAGAVEGYKYSATMTEKAGGGLAWDEANLDAYLENPKAVVPKGKMAFAGLKNESDRKDIIAYLKEAGAGAS